MCVCHATLPPEHISCSIFGNALSHGRCINPCDLLLSTCRKTLEQQAGSCLKRTMTPSQICPSRDTSLAHWPCMTMAHGAPTRNSGMRRMCQSLCRHWPCLGFQCCNNTLRNLSMISFDVSWPDISFIWFGLRYMHMSAEIVCSICCYLNKKAARRHPR